MHNEVWGSLRLAPISRVMKNSILTTAAATGHMEKQEMEMKWKLEMETGKRNWKLKTEMENATS